MFGTKCPSITSRWIQSAPAASTARTSSPNLAKSEARIDGAMTRGRDANWADICAFPGFLQRETAFRVTRGSPAGNAGRTMRGGEKFCRWRHQLPGEQGHSSSKKPTFYWSFRDGTGFADSLGLKVTSRAMRLLSEFCHVACPWRCVVAAGCPAIPDQVEIGNAAGDRFQPGFEQPVRFIRQHRLRWFSPSVRARRLFAAIAGHHERATGSAEPVII